MASISSASALFAACVVFAGAGCKTKTDKPASGVDDPEQVPEVVEPAERDDKRAERDAEPAAPDPGTARTVSVLIEDETLWLATGDGVATRLSDCAGKLDVSGLAGALCDLRKEEAFASQTAIEIAAVPSVAYQNVVDVMDVSLGAGYSDIGFVDPPSLSFELPAAKHETGEPRCDSEPVGCTAKSPSTGAVPPARVDLEQAPVVVVSKTEISLSGKKLIDVADVEKAEDWKIVALYDAMKAIGNDDGLVILQADKTISANVLNRVIKTLYAAEYANIKFAVKRRR